MLPTLILLALSTFVAEDLACIGAGVLIAQGKVSAPGGVIACLIGIVAGDLGLFAAGRLAGRVLSSQRWWQRIIDPAKVDRASEWLRVRGPWVIWVSRFTPGLRLPTYFAAGLLKTSFWRFAGYFVIAAAVWTPVLVGASALLGERLLREAIGSVSRIAAVFALITFVLLAARRLADYRQRRLLMGFMLRKIRWEFWSPLAAYIPVALYFVWLCIKHRSFAVFTAANPGIESGGLIGESKAGILRHLDTGDGRVARFLGIPPGRTSAERVAQAQGFVRLYPVVLKPDVGERGSGVSIARSQSDVEAYLRVADGSVIIQDYVFGPEFSVFYHRHPSASRGAILGITAKRLPTVAGDGVRSLEQLILADSRAVCLARVYLEQIGDRRASVPAVGEEITLGEIGSHCRGAIFENGSHLATQQLEEAVERISRRHAGFYIGRYDMRAPSVDAFVRGEFTVIELNGVAGEPTFIYDPSVSIVAAYRALFAQWRLAFEIGAANVEAGAKAMRVSELIALLRRRLLQANNAVDRGSEQQTISRPEDSPANSNRFRHAI